jgi:YidC/Oxa1 family membrane protein insertase
MQERSSSSPSIANIVAFAAIFLLAMVVYPMIMAKINPPPPQAAKAPLENEKKGEEQKGDEKKNDKAAAQKKIEADKKAAAPKQPKPSDEPVDQTIPANVGKPDAVKKPPQDNDDRRWITMGSVDPDLKENPFRMGATFSRAGGSLVRLELSSEHYRDLDDRSGYLGHLVIDRSDKGPGCLVQVVVSGTPADKAGIKPGDRIMAITYRSTTSVIGDAEGLEALLRTTEPKDKIELTVRRRDAKDRNDEKVSATLIRRPLEVIRPERKMPILDFIRNGPTDAIDLEDNCPRPFLTTLQQVDDDKLRADEDPKAKFEEEMPRELAGVHLRDALWTIESPQKNAAGVATQVVFSCEVPERHIKVTKTYELAKLAGDGTASADDQAYHLTLSVAITNLDTKKHEVAYRQDGPNGLPVEGSWYVSSKVNRKWFTLEGMRDVVYQTADSEVGVVTCSELAEKVEETEKYRKEIGEASQFAVHRPVFFGVDAQYFSVAMLPDPTSTAPNIERAIALRVGEVQKERPTLTNTSFRLIGKTAAIEPGKTSEPQRYEIFAGPKRQELLDKYQLSGLIYYGLTVFRMVAVPMTHVLDFFYSLVHSYGLAIIMLTVVVRLCMFPLSRKQALNAQMMQKLQPEMKAIQQKFKKDPEGARKAQMELYSKHNYNPAQACLPMFIQLPIFMGLYRALQVNVELRGAQLIPSTWVQWCSNLAAPDMFFDWSRFMPAGINNGIGFKGVPLIGPMLGLGPYLNLLPIITIALYLIQQKVMMPPAVDEQAAAQQKMMKYMMIFVGLMFYKVAAGLCIYFIATTIWSLAERRFVPKAAPAGGGDSDDEPVEVKTKIVKQPRLTDSEREAIRRQKRKK